MSGESSKKDEEVDVVEDDVAEQQNNPEPEEQPASYSSDSAGSYSRSSSDHSDRSEDISAGGRLEEWESVDIPDEWRPLPLLKVSSIPQGATEEELRSLLEEEHLDVRSVLFDPKQASSNGLVAFVRLTPPDGTAAIHDGNNNVHDDINNNHQQLDDAAKVAENAVSLLRSKEPKLELLGKQLHFERPAVEVNLFLSNIPADLSTDVELRTDCEKHGPVERCFIMRNPAGLTKSYGFVEYTLPSGAAKCKDAWFKAADATLQENKQHSHDSSARSDHHKQQQQQGRRIESNTKRVKLQRAEPTAVKSIKSLFSSELYVDNLMLNFTDKNKLYKLFEPYGDIDHIHLPRSTVHPQHNKGFAFVGFTRSYEADIAYRALDGTDHAGIGRLLISFNNPGRSFESKPPLDHLKHSDRATGAPTNNRPRGGANTAAHSPRYSTHRGGHSHSYNNNNNVYANGRSSSRMKEGGNNNNNAKRDYKPPMYRSNDTRGRNDAHVYRETRDKYRDSSRRDTYNTRDGASNRSGFQREPPSARYKEHPRDRYDGPSRDYNKDRDYRKNGYKDKDIQERGREYRGPPSTHITRDDSRDHSRFGNGCNKGTSARGGHGRGVELSSGGRPASQSQSQHQGQLPSPSLQGGDLQDILPPVDPGMYSVMAQQQMVQQQRMLTLQSMAIQQQLALQSALAKRELEKAKEQLRQTQEELKVVQQQTEAAKGGRDPEYAGYGYPNSYSSYGYPNNGTTSSPIAAAAGPSWDPAGWPTTTIAPTSLNMGNGGEDLLQGNAWSNLMAGALLSDPQQQMAQLPMGDYLPPPNAPLMEASDGGGRPFSINGNNNTEYDGGYDKYDDDKRRDDRNDGGGRRGRVGSRGGGYVGNDGRYNNDGRRERRDDYHSNSYQGNGRQGKGGRRYERNNYDGHNKRPRY